MGLLGLSGATALAACNPVTFVPATQDVGTKGFAALTNSDVSGYKSVGRTATALRAVCDDKPDSRQITIDSLVAAGTPGLVRWASSTAGASSAGAARIVIQQATVGGYAVPMTFTPNGGATSAASLGPVDLTSAGLLVLDLRSVPSNADARKTFDINLQVQTMVKSAGFVPTGATPFRLVMGATLP